MPITHDLYHNVVSELLFGKLLLHKPDFVLLHELAGYLLNLLELLAGNRFFLKAHYKFELYLKFGRIRY